MPNCTYTMPDGSYMEITRTTDSCDGREVEVVVGMPPKSGGPPTHIHPTLAERFEVLEGSFELYVDGAWRVLRVGESVDVPARTPHGFRNPFDQACRVRTVHTPPARFEEYVRELGDMCVDGRIRGLDLRSLVHVARLWSSYGDTLVAASAVQRVALSLLGRLATMLGHRPRGPSQEARASG